VNCVLLQFVRNPIISRIGKSSRKNGGEPGYVHVPGPRLDRTVISLYLVMSVTQGIRGLSRSRSWYWKLGNWFSASRFSSGLQKEKDLPLRTIVRLRISLPGEIRTFGHRTFGKVSGTDRVCRNPVIGVRHSYRLSGTAV
jgi:hypothetical protein